MPARAETTVVYTGRRRARDRAGHLPRGKHDFHRPRPVRPVDTEYGVLFLTQVATAITVSLLGAWLARRFGTKRVYLAGLACGLVSMLLLSAAIAVAMGFAPFGVTRTRQGDRDLRDTSRLTALEKP